MLGLLVLGLLVLGLVVLGLAELPPLAAPLCLLRHSCSSAPVIPVHWVLDALPVAELSPAELPGVEVLGEELLPDELLPAEGVDPVVASEPDAPALLPALPLEDCAHVAVPKPIKAAVTAALIAFTIMMEFL